MEKAEELLNKDYYRILGVAKTANDEQLRSAYRRMALRVHPDRRSTADASQKFVELNEAYRYLCDPAKRASYDRLYEHLQRPAATKDHHPGLGRRKTDAGSSTRLPKSAGMNRQGRPRRRSDAGSSVPVPNPAASARRRTDSEGRKPQSPSLPHNPESFQQEPQVETATPADAGPTPPAVPTSNNDYLGGENTSRTKSTPGGRPQGFPVHTESPDVGGTTRPEQTSFHAQRKSRRRMGSDPEDVSTDISLLLPRPKPRSRSAKPRVARDSETDVSQRPPPLYPLKPEKNPLHSLVPSLWVFPLRLTLEELYHGCSQRFGISRTLLSGDRENVIVDINVQPGWRKGTRITFPRAGNQMADGTYQDLVFVVRPLPHAVFVREGESGEHLSGLCGLQLCDALVPDGKTAKITGLHGLDIRIELPDFVVHPGMETVVTGEGMPVRKAGKVVGKGDLIIRWAIIFPDDLSAEQQQELRRLLG